MGHPFHHQKAAAHSFAQSSELSCPGSSLSGLESLALSINAYLYKAMKIYYTQLMIRENTPQYFNLTHTMTLIWCFPLHICICIYSVLHGAVVLVSLAHDAKSNLI